ncbi:hypothetical protein [Flavobacterium humi]|uniref:Uncharacterized protein n=1 Tax=Flavobacterium humi TaxID=2562683 RepID=A0A4Z0L4C2_9FLAO|nr:hypothetical protein [Flavobacterium humi]TGD56799.1 hypothetical protein E4635_15290 [Flavobacterium humi]
MEIIKKFWPLVLIAFFALFTLLNSIYHGIEENKSSYNFKITKIETTPTRSLIFYNGKKEVVLWNFTISKGHGIAIGDYLIKDRCAEILYIKRKKPDGKFMLVHSSRNNSYFANLICD